MGSQCKTDKPRAHIAFTIYVLVQLTFDERCAANLRYFTLLIKIFFTFLIDNEIRYALKK